MYKLFSLAFFSLSLFAQEPTLGILESIQTNTRQIFIIGQSRYKCDAYGVLGVEKLLKNRVLNSACKQNIQRFYEKHPEAKFFIHRKLKSLQRYHIEFQESECVLFASGEITLSELLLKKGFALLNPLFKDKEYLQYYEDAQALARFEKRGIWKDGTIRDCVAELYEK